MTEINSSEQKEWNELINLLQFRLNEEGLNDKLLFHGSSNFVYDDIQSQGLSPNDVEVALFQNNHGIGKYGTFWGNLTTANDYALDTSTERHVDSKPMLIASRIEDLLADTIIVPDGATFDFPIDNLTQLHQPSVLKNWELNHDKMTWEDSLRDLGAVICIHDFTLPAEELFFVQKIEDVDNLILDYKKLLQPPLKPVFLVDCNKSS